MEENWGNGAILWHFDSGGLFGIRKSAILTVESGGLWVLFMRENNGVLSCL